MKLTRVPFPSTPLTQLTLSEAPLSDPIPGHLVKVTGQCDPNTIDREAITECLGAISVQWDIVGKIDAPVEKSMDSTALSPVSAIRKRLEQTVEDDDVRTLALEHVATLWGTESS